MLFFFFKQRKMLTLRTEGLVNISEVLHSNNELCLQVCVLEAAKDQWQSGVSRYCGIMYPRK